MNSAKVLTALRAALLLLIFANVGWTAYKFWAKGTFDWTTLVPVFALLVFYVIFRPKTS